MQTANSDAFYPVSVAIWNIWSTSNGMDKCGHRMGFFVVGMDHMASVLSVIISHSNRIRNRKTKQDTQQRRDWKCKRIFMDIV